MNDLQVQNSAGLMTNVICSARVTSKGHYVISSPLMNAEKTLLSRDEDFGVIPGTKKPSLFKSGAEKVVLALGLFQRYYTESAIENFESEPFFFYRVRCELIKIAADGREYVFASAMGSANTRERRNGRSGAFDSANSTLKMAEKRALVAAALAISGLSSMFTQDMDNEEFMEKYDDLVRANKTDTPTQKQVKMAHTRLTQLGYGTKGRKELISGLFPGKDSIAALTSGEFERLLEWIDDNAKNTEGA